MRQTTGHRPWLGVFCFADTPRFFSLSACHRSTGFRPTGGGVGPRCRWGHSSHPGICHPGGGLACEVPNLPPNPFADILGGLWPVGGLEGDDAVDRPCKKTRHMNGHIIINCHNMAIRHFMPQHRLLQFFFLSIHEKLPVWVLVQPKSCCAVPVINGRHLWGTPTQQTVGWGWGTDGDITAGKGRQSTFVALLAWHPSDLI